MQTFLEIVVGTVLISIFAAGCRVILGCLPLRKPPGWSGTRRPFWPYDDGPRKKKGNDDG